MDNAKSFLKSKKLPEEIKTERLIAIKPVGQYNVSELLEEYKKTFVFKGFNLKEGDEIAIHFMNSVTNQELGIVHIGVVTWVETGFFLKRNYNGKNTYTCLGAYKNCRIHKL